jgi:hypothetical protein
MKVREAGRGSAAIHRKPAIFRRFFEGGTRFGQVWEFSRLRGS